MRRDMAELPTALRWRQSVLLGLAFDGLSGRCLAHGCERTSWRNGELVAWGNTMKLFPGARHDTSKLPVD